MSVMWKNSESHARMRAWHQKFRDHIPEPLMSRTVGTTYGETHVLIGGPVDAPPVVVLHGALASSAHLMLEFRALLGRYRVYGVDLLGQSPMSADVRLPVHDNSAGLWLGEVLDQLGLDRVALIGVSWGGFVAQRFAAVAPDRLTDLVLLVPAGLVAAPMWRGWVEMGWPLTRYLFRPTPANRDALLRALLTTVDDPLWGPYLADAFQAANMRTMKVPRVSSEGEFAGLRCPVHVVGAERDVSFPGDRVIARARQIFPNLQSAEVLAGTRHSPPTTPEFRAVFGRRIDAMITATA